jgi:hypothetical protein
MSVNHRGGRLCVDGLLSGGIIADPADYVGATATVGTLALILVYMSVTAAEMAVASRKYRLVGIAGGSSMNTAPAC